MTTSPDYRNTRFWEKLSRIRAGQYRTGDFMIADAKDVDVAGGVPSMGRCRDETTGASGRLRTRPEFLDQVRELIRQDVLDIMLSSTATIEQLTDEGVFDETRVLSAFRGNEATDAWVGIRGGRYRDFPPRPYRGAALEFARAPLCLYSVTYINDAEHDASSLETYARFRAEARANDKMHFLEVFNPNVETGIAEDQIGFFINDCVIRTLASLTRRERPEFLKVAYNGPASLEELAGHDPSMVIGVLGGGQRHPSRYLRAPVPGRAVWRAAGSFRTQDQWFGRPVRHDPVDETRGRSGCERRRSRTGLSRRSAEAGARS